MFSTYGFWLDQSTHNPAPSQKPRVLDQTQGRLERSQKLAVSTVWGRGLSTREERASGLVQKFQSWVRAIDEWFSYWRTAIFQRELKTSHEIYLIIIDSWLVAAWRCLAATFSWPPQQDTMLNGVWSKERLTGCFRKDSLLSLKNCWPCFLPAMQGIAQNN